MNAARFDSTVQNLSNNWEFDELLDFLRKNAVKNSKQLEFCVYLADAGLLDELHKFISINGLYNLKSLANDPENTYEKRENAKVLLNIYESEMLAVFERQFFSLPGVDGNLLSFSLYADTSVLTNYIIKNKDIIFQAEQPPKTLMCLTYAINKSLHSNTEDKLLKLLLDSFDNLKKVNTLRKAYITKLIATKLLTNKNIITFPKVGYNSLHKLLGIIAAQKNKHKNNGAARLYTLISDVIRPELKKPTTSKKLGWNSKPKVAVCISGMYRCGNLALDSVYKNIIEPLDADVFFHSWKEMQEWPGLGGAGDVWLLRIFNNDIFNKCPTALRSKKYFKEKFPRTYTLIDAPLDSIFDPARLPETIKFKKIKLEDPTIAFQEHNIEEASFLSLGSLNQAKMLYGIYKAHELAVNHEIENGFRYDYVIRCRPDIGLHNKLSFSALETLKADEVAMDFTKEYGPQDQFWYGQRAAALSMASLWAASIDSNSLSPFPDHPQMRAHGLILGWMTDNHLQPVHTSITRDMKMASAKATPPDFSAALAEDFANEASDLSQDQKVLDFFAALQGFNE